jgi:ribosome-associated protein
MKPDRRPLELPEHELEERFIRSSGPGGQNVNKVSSAVQLRFDVRGSGSLSDEVKHRLLALAGKRAGADGVLVITARTHREQALNRAEARERLAVLIQQASLRPKKRKKTRPTAASRQRRLDSKRRLSHKKKQRRGDWD